MHFNTVYTSVEQGYAPDAGWFALPFHRTAMALLQVNRVNVLPWPSRSPDLNPIEHIWGVIGREVRRRGPRNVRHLQQFVVEELNRIARCTCHTVQTFF